MDRHRLNEQRSLEAHRRIAERIRRDPKLLDDARERVRRWADAGTLAPRYAERWRALLDGPIETLVELLASEDEEAVALRQVSPFAGVLSPRERWSLWSEVAERLSRDADPP